MFIGINGGINDLDVALGLLKTLDGVMLGRAAYQEPALLGSVDRLIHGIGTDDADPLAVVERMRPFIAAHLAAGGRLSAFTRHMLGLYHKVPGARAWRRILTEGGVWEGAGLEVIDTALDALQRRKAA